MTLVVAVFLARCPWPACHYLNLNTYTITTLYEYQRFLSNEASFKALHRVAAVRLECSALRDDVVTALQSGRLTLGLSKPAMAQEDMAKPGLFRAWHQGLVLHLVNTMSDDEREQETWAAGVQAMVVSQKQDELSFLGCRGPDNPCP